MSFVYIMGICFGCAVAILIVYLLSKRAGECHFDEMQLKLRGDGFKLGFLTLISCGVIYAFFSEWIGQMVLSTGFASLLITFIGILAFTMFCIIKEAFFSVGDNGKKYLILCLVIAAGNLLLALDRVRCGDILVDGKVTIESGSNLLMAVFFSTILFTLIGKMLSKRNSNEES